MPVATRIRSELPARFRSIAATLAFLGVCLTAASLQPGSVQAQTGQNADAPLSPELVAVRAALDKYKDPILAVHDGYFSSVACLGYSQGMSGHGGMDYKAGGMGVHFLNAANIGPTLDPLKPQVLLYEPVGDKLQLVAAEWFVPTQVSKEAPTIFGQTLQGPMAGHEPVLPEALHHWDLHVWLWKSNPSGLFSSTNPTVKCPKTGYSFDEKPPMMVKP
jgi:hypothetical protein